MAFTKAQLKKIEEDYQKQLLPQDELIKHLTGLKSWYKINLDVVEKTLRDLKNE